MTDTDHSSRHSQGRAWPWRDSACWASRNGRSRRSRRAKRSCRSPTSQTTSDGRPARPAHARHSDDRRPVHAEGQVRHDAALRPPRRGPGDVQAEGHRPGEPDEVVLARRTQEDGRQGAGRRLRVLGQPRPVAGAVRQRTLDGRAAQDRPRCRGREGQREGVRLLRRRSRPGRNRVADAEVHARAEFRPQPAAREGVVAGAVPGLRAERRTADEASGRAASADRAGLLRRLQRQVALAHPPAGRRSTSAGSRRAGTARCAAK